MYRISTLVFFGCALSVAMPQALRQAQGRYYSIAAEVTSNDRTPVNKIKSLH
ncbi:hypothetical protein [Nostoc sp.]|uniref:hypothetical protein n=1 Tax=Nostoc sp. TaxID=1180 RepID=UPI002FF0FA00